MKDSSEYGARLKRLVNRLTRAGASGEAAPANDLMTELVLGCLSAYTTEAKARTAWHRLRSNFVDYNELRVSRAAEVADVLGRGFPEARPAAEQLLTLLQGIFDKYDSLNLEPLRELSKRDAKLFLEALPGSSPYVVAWLMLRGLGAHAMPVGETLLTMLREEGVVDPSADAPTVQGFLERQISSQRVHKVYALLRQHADNPNKKPARPAKKAADKAPPRRNPKEA